jgi:hypothetical protein
MLKEKPTRRRGWPSGKADQGKKEAERKADREVAERLEAIHNQQKMDSWIADMNSNRKETTARQNTEPDPGMIQSVGKHQEVPKEETAVMPVVGLRKRRRDQNLAARHRQKPKGRIQVSREPRKRLTIAGRKVTCRASVAWRKRNVARKDGARANVIQEIRRGRTFVRRRRPKPECSNSIGRRDVEEPLHRRKERKTANNIGGQSRRQQPRLEIMGKSNEVFGKTIGLEFGKRTARSTVGLQRIRLDLVERSTPSETEKEAAGRAGADYAEAPAPTAMRERKKNNSEGIDRTLSGAARDERT